MKRPLFGYDAYNLYESMKHYRRYVEVVEGDKKIIAPYSIPTSMNLDCFKSNSREIDTTISKVTLEAHKSIFHDLSGANFYSRNVDCGSENVILALEGVPFIMQFGQVIIINIQSRYFKKIYNNILFNIKVPLRWHQSVRMFLMVMKRLKTKINKYLIYEIITLAFQF